MLSEFADPQRAPEVLGLRETIRSWRFYDHIRTDADAPARRSKIGTRTFVLDHDGADLAAALQTIVEVGDASALDAAIDSAFPGSRLSIARADTGVLSVQLHQHGLLRPLGAGELSDGTLRYLLWVAALLSPRPASMLVLNEPETSLHSDLLPSAADLIGHAATQTQVIAVTHSPILIDALRRSARNALAELGTIELVKEFGETVVAGREPPDEPPWHWPKR
jgi:predicted ATPase